MDRGVLSRSPYTTGRNSNIYSIAIWDDVERVLVLARDRLGVKPLYYCVVRDTMVFASELKALLVHPDVPRSIDWGAFQEALNPVFPFERPAGRAVATGIQGVTFVDPATYIEWRGGLPGRAVKYWEPPEPDDARAGLDSAADYVDRYADLVSDSVRMQLMSDVPVGLFLSGGVDSSLIGSIASRLVPGLEAFTLVEPSITLTGDTAAAMRLARALDIRLHMVRVDQDALRATMGVGLQALEYFVWTMDFPLFDVELLFKHELHRFAKSANPDMKVILLGQGADEFAGGYSRIASESWTAFTETEARAFHVALLARLGAPATYGRYLSPSMSEPMARAGAGRHEPWQYLRFGDLAAYNLWHEDRMASANGMEVRVPFLDHRIVELLCSVPLRFREELFYDKAIERRAALRFLPAELAQRPKVPLFQKGAGRDDSVSALRRGLVLGAFDEYRVKYLEPAQSLFSLKEVSQLRDQAAVPRAGDAAVQLLCRCMAISIFERMCRDLRQPTFEPPRLTTTSPPLTTTCLPTRRTTKLTSTSRIALSEAVRLALSCDAPPALLVIQDGVLAAQIPAPAEWDWSRVPRSVLSGGQLDIAGLASAFGVDVDAMRPLAEAFVGRGWGALVNGGSEAGADGGRTDDC